MNKSILDYKLLQSSVSASLYFSMKMVFVRANKRATPTLKLLPSPLIGSQAFYDDTLLKLLKVGAAFASVNVVFDQYYEISISATTTRSSQGT